MLQPDISKPLPLVIPSAQGETKGLFGFFFFFFFITHHSSLNFRHSLFKIPQFPNPARLAHFAQLLITHTFLIFVGSILVTWLDRSCQPTHGHIFFSFLISPSPFHPCYSPKTQTRTHKNFRSSLTLLGPSPVNNTHLSNVYWRRYLLCRDLVASTSIKKCVPVVLSPRRFQWTFVLGFWIGRNRTDGEFFNGVLDFCLERMNFFLLDHFCVAIVGVLDVGLRFACHGFFFFFSSHNYYL